MSKPDANMIAALKRERAGYITRGAEDRVAQVDEQLRHHGYEPDPVVDETGAPVGRTDPGEQQQTAEQTAPAQPAARKATAKKTAAKPPASDGP